MDAIVVTDSVRVPERALTMRAVRASGPGGQNVNKVASKVDLRVDLEAIEGLTDPARDRLRALVGRRLDAEGRLQITSQVTRDQTRNLEDAREKVRTLVATAMLEPKRRRASRPTAAARQRRIESKKLRAVVKRSRGRPRDWM